MSKKYLVIGANSFLSKEIIQRLKLNSKVVGVYHINNNNLLPDVENIPVTELWQLKDEFDGIYLISAYIPGKDKKEDTKLLNEVNVNLPDYICKKFKKAKIIYASSVSVYGETDGVLIESSLTSFPSEYGKSKILGEDIVRNNSHHSIIRISSMYGEGMNASTFIPQIVISALKNGRIKLLGDGTRMQNYIHVSDVAEIIIRSIERQSNDTYLAVGEKSYSNFEVASFIRDALNGVEIVFEGEDTSKSFYYNACYTYKALGIKPQINIKEGIKELIKWKQRTF